MLYVYMWLLEMVGVRVNNAMRTTSSSSDAPGRAGIILLNDRSF